MARARPLKRPPIQEAVMQFQFSGAELSRQSLERLAAGYEARGWKRTDVSSREVRIDASGSSSDSATFAGFLLTAPGESELVQLRSDSVAASTRSYLEWEALVASARDGFDLYARDFAFSSVVRLSTRFINRVPPIPKLTEFEQILERPPLTVEAAPGAEVSDFLRRHVVTNLEGGFTALLTIGTVARNRDEPTEGKALVIDIDVYKECNLPLSFEALEPELTKLRSVKNTLFFGSLKEDVISEFES